MLVLSKIIVFLACHGAPADHFATYAEVLKEQGYEVQVYATGMALKKFQDRNIEVKVSFSLENLEPVDQDALAAKIAKTCSKASLIFTDVGHDFSIKMQEALAIYASKVPRVAYYENLEPFVPGGYSSTFSKVLQKANAAIFANEALVDAKIYSEPGKEIDFVVKKRLGIGYYPLAQAEKILQRRKLEHTSLRSAFLAERGIHDRGQKILVYFGGNNTEYFSKAFPAFLSFLPGASEDIVVVVQQHPGAKEKNEDGMQVVAWLKEFGEKQGTPRVILSDLSSEDAQVLADAALYYQTSMGPQFVLEGNPVIQIGHEIYEDILVKNRIAPAVTSATQLVDVVKGLDKQIENNPKNAAILRDLIHRKDWPQVLGDIVKKSHDLAF